MDKYNDLELCVLSCLLLKPKLMDKVILEDKHFIKHQKIWLFMKSFYKKFGTFDFNLMLNVSKNKYRMFEYIMWLIDKEPMPSMFEEYQKQLIYNYNELKKDKYIIEKVYELATDLYVRNIEVSDFKNKVEEIYKNAEEIYKGSD